MAEKHAVFIVPYVCRTMQTNDHLLLNRVSLSPGVT